MAVGCTSVVIAFVGPLIFLLFTGSETMVGSGSWWGWLTASLAVILVALVMIARIGWRDD